MGQKLHTDGVRASYKGTIVNREGNITWAILETQSMVETYKNDQYETSNLARETFAGEED